jgi:osmotically-inducible protein OsmY
MSMTTKVHSPLVIEDLVNGLLHSSSAEEMCNVHCETSGSQVILRGCVSSMDRKELASSLAKQICGMREIANEIHVSESMSS